MSAQALLALPGFAILALAGVDTISTAIRVDRRGGPVTQFVSRVLWHAFRGGRAGHATQLPALTGVAITMAIIVAWVLMALSGWYLLFSADPDAIVSASTGQPADAWDRLYFTSYTLSTLGMGDFVPSGAPWQVATGIASGFGFGVATLVITYLAGVSSAVTAKRQLARSIWGMGRSPQHVVRRAWDGGQFVVLPDHLMNLTTLLHGVAEQHRAYPLISYFRSRDRRAADVPAVAMLHDVLVILSTADDEHCLPELVTQPVLDAIDAYLLVLPGSDVEQGQDDTPPWPDLESLADDGIPVGVVTDLDESDTTLARRRRLGAVMHHQGWGWHDLEEA